MRFKLPLAPSSNALFANRKKGGRFKTQAYRAWEIEAQGWYYEQRLSRFLKEIRGTYQITLTVPLMHKDLDNIIKATVDTLVRWKLTPDDKLLRRLVVEVGNVGKYCIVDAQSYEMDEMPEGWAQDDAAKSFDAAYEAVREQVKAGGKTWKPKP